MQIIFLVEIRFWIEDKGVSYYKNYVNESKVKDIKYATL